jgi:hypothetical protein
MQLSLKEAKICASYGNRRMSAPVGSLINACKHCTLRTLAAMVCSFLSSMRQRLALLLDCRVCSATAGCSRTLSRELHYSSAATARVLDV